MRVLALAVFTAFLGRGQNDARRIRIGMGLDQSKQRAVKHHAGSAGSFYALTALKSSRDEAVEVVLNSDGDRDATAS